MAYPLLMKPPVLWPINAPTTVPPEEPPPSWMAYPPENERPVEGLLDAGPGLPDVTQSLWRHFVELPPRVRMQLVGRTYGHTVLNVAWLLFIGTLVVATAFLAHMLFMWLLFSGFARFLPVRPPLLLLLVIQVPSLRLSAWLGSQLARSLLGGMLQYHQHWCSSLLMRLRYEVAIADFALERRTVSGPMTSAAVPLHAQRLQPHIC